MVPKHLSKWCLQHRWKEIDAVDAEMIGEFKKKYGLKKFAATVAASGVERVPFTNDCAEAHCMAACTNCPESTHELY